MRTNPGGPPLNAQSGLPSASAVARKKTMARSMKAVSDGGEGGAGGELSSSRSAMRRLSKASWSRAIAVDDRGSTAPWRSLLCGGSSIALRVQSGA